MNFKPSDNEARQLFLKNLPNIPLKTFFLKIFLITVMGIITPFVAFFVIPTNEFTETLFTRFPEVIFYIPAIVLGYFAIYKANLKKLTADLFPKVKFKSKNFFWTIFIVDLIVTIIFAII